MKRVALVGVGGIAQSHLQGWAQQTDAKLTLLCDVRPDIAAERKERYGLTDAEIVTDFQAVLDSDCELVDLCTPSFLHAEQSIACLQAGKHVLSEKPMADSLADAEAIASAAADASTVYMCEHRVLFDPLIVAVRERLADIGRPFWLHQRSAHSLGLSQTIRETGAFLDMGYHPLYVALHFLGAADSVFALKRQVRPEVVDDNGLYVVEHGEAVSVLQASFSAIGPSGGTRPFELWGESGTFIGNWVPRPSLTLHLGEQGTGKQETEELTLPAGSWYANAIQHFVDVVDGKAEPLADAQAALATMRLFTAALRSAEHGTKEAV